MPAAAGSLLRQTHACMHKQSYARTHSCMQHTCDCPHLSRIMPFIGFSIFFSHFLSSMNAGLFDMLYRHVGLENLDK